MKKVFSLVDEARGIVQITTDDERFYVREGADPVTGNPTHIWLPSASWIASYCPKGIAYYKWLAEKGWDEAEAIKSDRGKYGTRVHKAVELLVNGETVALDEELPSGDGLTVSTLTADEYTAVNQFATWWKELTDAHETVEVVFSEHLIWCPTLGFAGTTDLLLKVDSEHWLIDLKTSKYIGDSYKAQLSAYRRALELDGYKGSKQFILQVGYPYNKKGFKLTEIEDSYHLFEAARTFWSEANNGSKPQQVHLPMKISLGLKKNMSKGKTTSKKKSK